MSSRSVSDFVERTVNYAERAAACERCAEHLDGRVGVEGHVALPDAWLANKLRAESSVWRQLSESNTLVCDHIDLTQRGAAPAPKAGEPLTTRMIETLVEMKKGTMVQSDEFFSWPRWKCQPVSSIGCPTRAMLEGLNKRGLLSVSRQKGNILREWLIEINNAGREALIAHELGKKAKKPSPFKRYSISYCVKQLDNSRTSLQPVTARTEAEAFSKLKKELQRRNASYDYSDFRVEWVGGQ